VLDTMDCLRDGVPPLLLIDLFGAAGPDAAHIYADEPADDLSWTHPIAEHVALVESAPPIQVPAARAAPATSSGHTPVG
jgi:hypothetical protein